MKPRIPFRIGYQYDNWELNLISIADTVSKNGSYCSYLWVGSTIRKFLNFTPHRIELIFYWDRLEVVILEFDKKSEHYYNRMNKALSEKFQSFAVENLPDGTIIYKFNDKKVSYWNIYYAPAKAIKLIYFSNQFSYIHQILE